MANLSFFTTLGFWKKIDVYREQPDVHYEYELVLLLETDSGNLGWSTYHGYNELMQERARVPTLKVKSLESRCKCRVIYELFKSSKIIAQMILLETIRFMFYNLEF